MMYYPAVNYECPCGEKYFMDRGEDGRLIGPPSQCECGRTLAGIMPVYLGRKKKRVDCSLSEFGGQNI